MQRTHENDNNEHPHLRPFTRFINWREIKWYIVDDVYIYKLIEFKERQPFWIFVKFTKFFYYKSGKNITLLYFSVNNTEQ